MTSYSNIVQHDDQDQQSDDRTHGDPLSPSEHVRRLQELARARGVVGPVRIGPVTATCVLEPVRLWQNTNLERIRESYLVCGQLVGGCVSMIAHGRQCPTGMRVVMRTHRARSNGFFNQLPFTCLFEGSSRTVSLKLFANGKIHMTGLRSVEEACSISQAFADILTDVCIRPVQSASHKILMINSNFKIGTPIQLRHMCETLNSLARWDATYNPDIYPAVNARNNALRTSAFLFGTGSVVVAAAKTHDILQETVRQLLEDVLPAYYKHADTGRPKSMG